VVCFVYTVSIKELNTNVNAINAHWNLAHLTLRDFAGWYTLQRENEGNRWYVHTENPNIWMSEQDGALIFNNRPYILLGSDFYAAIGADPLMVRWDNSVIGRERGRYVQTDVPYYYVRTVFTNESFPGALDKYLVLKTDKPLIAMQRERHRLVDLRPPLPGKPGGAMYEAAKNEFERMREPHDTLLRQPMRARIKRIVDLPLRCRQRKTTI
jgi:hypothetical protein